jgi:hypothetical protein
MRRPPRPTSGVGGILTTSATKSALILENGIGSVPQPSAYASTKLTQWDCEAAGDVQRQCKQEKTWVSPCPHDTHRGSYDTVEISDYLGGKV